MSNLYQSLSHSKWNCKYHVVLVPKRRRKVLFGEVRRQLGEIFHALARQKECQILEGHLRPDHVHMCIAIPPKYPVASVIGFLKGKSAIAVARLCGRERNFTGEHLWARGYAVSTVGFERPLSTLESVALLIPVARASSDSERRRAMRIRRRFAASTSWGRDWG